MRKVKFVFLIIALLGSSFSKFDTANKQPVAAVKYFVWNGNDFEMGDNSDPLDDASNWGESLSLSCLNGESLFLLCGVRVDYGYWEPSVHQVIDHIRLRYANNNNTFNNYESWIVNIMGEQVYLTVRLKHAE